jgi:DNA polymerase/3'-5' exonuclease PolX
MNLSTARRLAERIEVELQPHCDRLVIAGSIRRHRPEVGDIDLVCIPQGNTGRCAILERCARTSKLMKEGVQYVVFELPGGFQLDLWFAHADQQSLIDTTPTNFGMLLLSRTGSARHNVYLAQVAKRRGLHFNPHRGILRGEEIVASRTEEEILSALGLPYIAPEDRER